MVARCGWADQAGPSLLTCSGELTTVLSVTTHTWSRPARFAW